MGVRMGEHKNKNLDNKKELEEKARQQTIKPRDALFGGRTEGFKAYHKCVGREQMHYRDVVRLCPTVNAMDDYATGFGSNVDITTEQIVSGEFIGMVKLDITPPPDLRIPALPEAVDGKLLFHLRPLKEETYTGVEVKKAIEKGYKIDKIHAAISYKKYTGLMKPYVEFF